MADIQPPVKPTERYFRLSRENFEEFLKKIGYREREDKRWERSRKGTSRKLRDLIKYHWGELPPPT